MSEKEGVKKAGWYRWLLGNRSSAWMCRMALVPLRFMVGVIFFAHGAQKAFGWFGGGGFQKAVGDLANLGFSAPTFWTVLLILAELVGGLLLIVGLAPRLAAAAIGAAMIVALRTAHADDGFFATHQQQMVLAACVTLFLAGAGELGVQRSAPRKQ